MEQALSQLFQSQRRWTTRDYIVAACILVAVIACWVPALSHMADQFVDDGLKRSLVSFATARALHSVVSVIQGTELGIQPMGVGLTLTLGQVLAPINDLISQFADMMLLASIAFGAQKLLLNIGGSWLFTLLLTIVALAWLLMQWRQRAPHWLSRLLVIALFARLVMPVTAIASEWIFYGFTQQTYLENQMAADNAVGELQRFDTTGELTGKTPAAAPGETSPPKADTPGLWGSVKQWATNPGDTVRSKIEQIKKGLDALVERLVWLIVVFLLQTLVIPLLMMWVLFQLCKGLVGSAVRA